MPSLYSQGLVGGLLADSTVNSGHSQGSELFASSDDLMTDDISMTLMLPSPRLSPALSNVENSLDDSRFLDESFGIYHRRVLVDFEENEGEVEKTEPSTVNETIARAYQKLINWTPAPTVAPKDLQLYPAPAADITAATAQLIGSTPAPIVAPVTPTQSNLPSVASPGSVAATGNAATIQLDSFAPTPTIASQTAVQSNVHSPLQTNPYHYILHPLLQAAMVALTPTSISPSYAQSAMTIPSPNTPLTTPQSTSTQAGAALTPPSTSSIAPPSAAISTTLSYYEEHETVSTTPPMTFRPAWTSTTQTHNTAVSSQPTAGETAATPSLPAWASDTLNSYTSSAAPSLPITQPSLTFTCRWLVSPGAICGVQKTNREKMVDHIKDEHRFIQTVDEKSPTITLKKCCWEGCKVALRPRTNMRAHLRTHLKVKDHQGTSSKGNRWSPYQKRSH